MSCQGAASSPVDPPVEQPVPAVPVVTGGPSPSTRDRTSGGPAGGPESGQPGMMKVGPIVLWNTNTVYVLSLQEKVF